MSSSTLPLHNDLAQAREELRDSTTDLMRDCSTVSARWAAGIARVQITHHRSGRNRIHLRLELVEAKRLRDELDAVIAEREPDA